MTQVFFHLAGAYSDAVEHHVTVIEEAIHLGLFVAAGLALAVSGLAVVERMIDGGRRTIRTLYVWIGVGVVLAFFAAERLYHALN
jgi:hypothetical protein